LKEKCKATSGGCEEGKKIPMQGKVEEEANIGSSPCQQVVSERQRTKTDA